MSKAELVRLASATFYKSLDFATRSNKAVSNNNLVFTNPIDFSIVANSKWAIIGSMKSEFLRVLAGQYVSEPVNSRIYPLRNHKADFSLELLQFTNNSYGHGAVDSSGGFTHLGARYEFFKDLEVDEKVEAFIADLSYNSTKQLNESKILELLNELKLKGLEDKFINGLSNGQFRRARIAKGLYKEPDFLLIDDPFLGLDPVATEIVSGVLGKTASSTLTTVTIGLRIQDEVPEWIENVMIVDSQGIVAAGRKSDLLGELEKLRADHYKLQDDLTNRFKDEFKSDGIDNSNASQRSKGSEPIIEMENVNVSYKGKPIIKDLNWEVKNGEKWHIRGKNGSGKTTLLALITLDHPQSWNRNIKINGIERQTGRTNFFDTNDKIGFTSPELHAIFPKNLSVFDSIATGYKVGSFLAPRDLSDGQIDKINRYLELVGLKDKKDAKFKEVSISHQKLVLLIRALIKDPQILILDESLSAMSDEDILKGISLINQWDKGCVLIIGHVDHEVPDCDKYILLNEANEGKYEIGVVNK